MSILDDAGLEQIERNAETILSEVGIAFQGFPEALKLWRDAGAQIDGELVRFPPGLCRQIITDNAPAVFTQHARNPARSVQVGPVRRRRYASGNASGGPQIDPAAAATGDRRLPSG